jgi:protein involved in polysaccharide export with SLBB domain
MKKLLIVHYLPVFLLALWVIGLEAQTSDPELDPPVLPGDHVELRISQEDDLSGSFPVDQHFIVTLPLIGDINVREETERSLRAKVREGLQEQLRNPSIQLRVLKRVRVLGAVIAPGIFYVDLTMSVADVVALAGGRTPAAREGAVALRRDGQVLMTDVFIDTLFSDIAVRTGDEILILERSWLDRNLGPVVTGISATVSVLIALLLSGGK